MFLALKNKKLAQIINSDKDSANKFNEGAPTIARMGSRLRLFAAQNVLHAVISFKRPKRKIDYWIPKGPHGWLDYMVDVVKKKTVIKSFTQKELRQVVKNARIQVSDEFSRDHQLDPDLPPCYVWSETEVGEWLELSGFSHLKETFMRNKIDGRRLIRVTSQFLIQVGLQDFKERTKVLHSIRSLLGLPALSTCDSIKAASQENIRAILFEKFLWKRSVTGRTSERLTFKAFCDQQGFTLEDICYQR